MSDGAGHQNHSHTDFAVWNPLSAAVHGADEAGRHDLVMHSGDDDLFGHEAQKETKEEEEHMDFDGSDISPNTSLPHSPFVNPTLQRVRVADRPARRRQSAEASSSEDSSSDTPSSVVERRQITARGKASSTSSPNTDDIEPANNSTTHIALPPFSEQKNVAWNPGKLPTPPKKESGRFPGRENRNVDDEDEDRKRPVFHMRPYEDDEPTDWWFASTAAPLLAATTAPLANLLSIAALVTPWRMNVDDGSGGILPDFEGVLFGDPHW
jgi:hypothetical protein